MALRVVFVEPMYQVNIGYAARVLKNFGIGRMYVVRPRCSITGKQAVKYSKHARELLEGAKVCDSIAQAAGSAFRVGTTAIWHKTEHGMYNVYTPAALKRVLRNVHGRDIALIIGRDNTGLTKDELAECDATVFIPAAKAYPTLNITHALAVLLYELTAAANEAEYGLKGLYATQKETAVVKRLFESMVLSRPDIRDRKAVSGSFFHILDRASPTKQEIRTLAVAFSKRAFNSGKGNKGAKAKKSAAHK